MIFYLQNNLNLNMIQLQRERERERELLLVHGQGNWPGIPAEESKVGIKWSDNNIVGINSGKT